MREDILLDNVNAYPNSKHLEYTMDGGEMSVPLAVDYSETDTESKGMRQVFFIFLFFFIFFK